MTEHEERVLLDLGEAGLAYRNLTSLVIPRPIAWVSSRSADGVDNLAPHSFFTVVSDDPPMVAFTSMSEKDTLRNVVATGEFVVCGTPVALRDQVNITGTAYPSDVSEFDEAGLEREASLMVAPPRVAAAPYALECRLVGTYAPGSGTLVVGEVVCMAVSPAVLVDGRVDAQIFDPVSRLGGSLWAGLGELFSIRRLPWPPAEQKDP
jgi:flavin reductase (DIM6/NTAB) family NADH-FMN oxidoreductase RutF